MEIWLPRITTWFAVLATMIGAIYVAQAIVEQNYFSLFIIISVILGLFYLLGLYQYTWKIALLLDGLGFIYAPIGFKISPIEISAVLIVALLVMTWWRKNLGMHQEFKRQPVVIVFTGVLCLLLVYAAGHFYFYWRNPFSPTDYSVKNSLKQMTQTYVPLFVILFALFKPKIFRLGGNIVKTLVYITLVYLILDIGIRIYAAYIQGPGLIDSGEGVNGRSAILFIKGINLIENIYVLRSAGPFAVLLGAFMLAERDKSANCGVSKIILNVLVLFGFIGAGLSGGRLAIILCIVFFAVALLVKHRVGVLLFLGALCCGMIAILNIFSDVIFTENTPEQVKRSVALVVFNHESRALEDAKGSIESSSEWRLTLFKRAIDEWRSNRTITWFGRDVYAFNYDDLVEVAVKGGYEGRMDSSLRRGATHCLLSDLLLIYGLVGMILYYMTLIIMVFMLLFLWRKVPRERGRRDLVWISLVLLIYYIIYATVGGTFFPNSLAWLVALCIAMGNSVFLDHKEKEQTSQDLIRMSN